MASIAGPMRGDISPLVVYSLTYMPLFKFCMQNEGREKGRQPPTNEERTGGGEREYRVGYNVDLMQSVGKSNQQSSYK
jgi:hypothetical protein